MLTPLGENNNISTIFESQLKQPLLNSGHDNGSQSGPYPGFPLYGHKVHYSSGAYKGLNPQGYPHEGLECGLLFACLFSFIVLYAGLKLDKHMLADIQELIQAFLKRLNSWKGTPGLNSQINFAL